MLLHKMMQLIPHETKLDPLINALKCLSEITIDLETIRLGKQVNPTSILQILTGNIKNTSGGDNVI